MRITTTNRWGIILCSMTVVVLITQFISIFNLSSIGIEIISFFVYGLCWLGLYHAIKIIQIGLKKVSE